MLEKHGLLSQGLLKSFLNTETYHGLELTSGWAKEFKTWLFIYLKISIFSIWYDHLYPSTQPELTAQRSCHFFK